MARRGRPKKPDGQKKYRLRHPRTQPVFAGDDAERVLAAIMAATPYRGRGRDWNRQLLADLIAFDRELRPGGQRLGTRRVTGPETALHVLEIYRRNDALPARLGGEVVKTGPFKLTARDKAEWRKTLAELHSLECDAEFISRQRREWVRFCRWQTAKPLRFWHGQLGEVTRALARAGDLGNSDYDWLGRYLRLARAISDALDP